MEITKSGRERRVHSRYGLNFSIRFKRLDSLLKTPAGAPTVEIAGTDLSVGGAGGVASLESLGSLELKAGEKMMVELILDDRKESLIAAAKVMWGRRREGSPELHFAGFKFVYIADEAKDRIVEALSRAALLD